MDKIYVAWKTRKRDNQVEEFTETESVLASDCLNEIRNVVNQGNDINNYPSRSYSEYDWHYYWTEVPFHAAQPKEK